MGFVQLCSELYDKQIRIVVWIHQLKPKAIFQIVCYLRVENI
jgi:hypothetical protein